MRPEARGVLTCIGVLWDAAMSAWFRGDGALRRGSCARLSSGPRIAMGWSGESDEGSQNSEDDKGKDATTLSVGLSGPAAAGLGPSFGSMVEEGPLDTPMEESFGNFC